MADYDRLLRRAMKKRADGSLHLDTCFNARVNSKMYSCQPDCTEAQRLIEKHEYKRTGKTQVAVRRVR